MTHSILVPMDGSIERITEPHDGPFALLDQRGAEGPAVQLALNPNNDGKYLCFRLAETPPQNNRARTILALLTDMHFVITGPAILTGLTDEETTTIMEQS